MFDHWEVGAAALLGAAGVILGIWVRSGGWRRGVGRTYFRRALPGYQRNAIFAFVPLGLGFVLIVAGATLGEARGGPSSASSPSSPQDPLVSMLILLAMVSLAFGFWVMFRPPGWMKPRWVREYERAQLAGQPVEDFSPKPMSPRAYTLNWVGLGIMAVVWVALGLPVGALLIGLGTGAALLAASRPRQA